MLVSFIIVRKHTGDSRGDVSTRSGDNHNMVVISVTGCEHDDGDFHFLLGIISKDRTIEVTGEFKEEHRRIRCDAVVFPSPEVRKVSKAPIVFYASLKVEFSPVVFIIPNTLVPGQPSKEERLSINLRGGNLNRLNHHVSTIPVHHSKTSGQIVKRRADKICRGLSVSDHECCLFSLLLELMVDEVGTDRRRCEANPARQSRNPITKAMLFRLRPRQPTWLRRGTKLVKLTVANQPDEHQPKKTVGEIPAGPVGLIFFTLVHPFALKLLIRKLLARHNVLQPRWSVA